MFNSFSFSELMTILVIVVIVFGPNRLPEMARRLGEWTARARRSIDALKTEINTEYKDVIDPLKEARDDIRGLKREIGDSARAIKADMDEAAAEARRNVEPGKPSPRSTLEGLAAASAAAASGTPAETPSESTEEGTPADPTPGEEAAPSDRTAHDQGDSS